jgi:O-antigen ligase
VLLLVIVVYVAMLYVRPAEIVPGLAELPLVQIMAGVGAVTALVSWIARPRNFMNRPSDRFLVGFWMAIVLSNLAWGWYSGASRGFTDFLTVAFSYFLIRAGATSERHVRVIVTALIAASLFQALNGIVQYHTGVGFGNVTMVEDNRIRGTGIFNDPNDLGMALVMVTPFLVSAVLESRFAIRFVALAALTPILLAIYYTNSRGAVLGLAAALLVYFKTRFRSSVAPVLAGVALVAVVAAAPARASNMSSDEASAQGRIQAWSAGLVMLKSHPIFGVGYGRFTEFHELVAHNSFVHTFAELGLLGAFCLVGMWASYFRALRGTPPTPMRRAFVASAAGTLVCAMFLSRQYVVVPYLLLALGTAHASISDVSAQSGTDRVSTLRIFTLAIAGIVATRVVVLVLGRF